MSLGRSDNFSPGLDPHPPTSHRLVLSEAYGRVEWIPPLGRFAPSVGMTTWSTSIALNGRWDQEAVIPSEANGRAEESMGWFVRGIAPKLGELSFRARTEMKRAEESVGGGQDRCRCLLPLFAVPVTVPVAGKMRQLFART